MGAENARKRAPVAEVDGGGQFQIDPFQRGPHAEAAAGGGEGLETQLVDMRPAEGEPGDMAEVALREVLGGEPAERGVVACHAREADVGPVYREVDHRRACAAEALDAICHGGVGAERHERTVAAPDGRLVPQAILHHQVPAVLLRVAGHAGEARSAHGRDHYKHVALFHDGQSTIPFGRTQGRARMDCANMC